VDPAAGTVTRGGECSRLEPKVMDVLAHLAGHPHQVLFREEILEAVWPDSFVAEAALSRCISELRRALHDDVKSPRYIETVHKRGYRVVAEVSDLESPDAARVVATPGAALHPAEPGTSAEQSGTEERGASLRSAPRMRLTVPRWQVAVPWTVIVVIAAVFLAVQWRGSEDPSAGSKMSRRVSIALSADQPLALALAAPLGVGRPSVALSPDGDHLVFVVERGGERQLFLRQLDSFETRAIAGTEGAFDPFFSPDGEWIGFFTERGLSKVSLRGGVPVSLCEARNPYGASWGPDGYIYFADGEGTRLLRVLVDGGAPEPLKSGGGIFWPQALPRDDVLLVTFFEWAASPARFSACLLDLETGHMTTLVRGATFARYLPTGHLVYGRSGALFAVPFDLDRLEVSGPEALVLDGVRTEAWPGAAQVAFSSEGTLAYVPGGDFSQGRLSWVDREGRVEPLDAETASYGSFRLSPDGKRLAVTVAGARDVIWVLDLQTGRRSRLTFEGNANMPVWTSDGAAVFFFAIGSHRSAGVYRRSVEGEDPAELVQLGGGSPWATTPDGRWLAYDQWDDETKENIWFLPLGVEGDALPIKNTSFNEWGATFSPDSRWIAYVSDESGRHEVYVEEVTRRPGSRRTMISTDGGEEPIWSADGDEIFYRDGDRWMVTPVHTGLGFSAGEPRTLFAGHYMNVQGYSYDVMPNGERFLLLEEVDPVPPTQINLVLDWFEELRHLVPSG